MCTFDVQQQFKLNIMFETHRFVSILIREKQIPLRVFFVQPFHANKYDFFQ